MFVSLEPPEQVTSVPAALLLQSLQTFSLGSLRRNSVVVQRRRVLYYLRNACA
jgi:hypothetical protein